MTRLLRPLPGPAVSCCPTMVQVLAPCERHPDPLDCPDKVVVRTASGELGMPIPAEAGGGYMQVGFCPFCGRRVPPRPGELERLYQDARGAVLAGGVMVGPEPDGVTRDEALEYAAALIQGLAPLFAEDEGELVRLTPGQVVASRDMLEALASEDGCELDHHGGCQSHGYISLEPGETCPQAELAALLADTL